MDDIVKQALTKWPNVPDCYGWLGLDARGRWFLRDDAAQALGGFTTSRGVPLQHEKLIAFIERNYEADARGQWFFQNGPQRVFVELEVAPWIWRVQASEFAVTSHTGRSAVVRECLLDAEGRVYLNADIGFGLVHTQDVGVVADALDAGLWSTQDVAAAGLPSAYGYVLSPKAASAAVGEGVGAGDSNSP